MIKSMTGFGKASIETGEKTITAEIRSLNSKSADINLRMPGSLRNYELELRNELSRLLERGKIDLSLSIESKKAEAPVEINLPLALAYYQQMKKLAEELGEPISDAVQQVMKFPDVLKSERRETDEKEWEQIRACITKAVEQLNKFRETEGQSLITDFETRLKKSF